MRLVNKTNSVTKLLVFSGFGIYSNFAFDDLYSGN